MRSSVMRSRCWQTIRQVIWRSDATTCKLNLDIYGYNLAIGSCHPNPLTAEIRAYVFVKFFLWERPKPDTPCTDVARAAYRKEWPC